MSEALELMGGLRLPDGETWGSRATAEQLADAEAFLDGDALFHYWTRSRGYSKTGDAAGLAIAALLCQVPEGGRAYVAAADRDQAALLRDAVAGYAARTPALAGALTVDQWRVTATRSGASLTILASDAPSSWGLTPHLIVADELSVWPRTDGARQFFESLASAAAKVADCRVLIVTSAGSPAHWSYGVLEHARSDPAWRTSELEGPAPWLDAGKVEEQRRRLPRSSFVRLFENRWTAAEDSLVEEDDLRACVTLEGPLAPQPGVAYVVGVDLGLSDDASVAVVAHAERVIAPEDQSVTGTRVVLDRIQRWRGRSKTEGEDRRVQLEQVEEWVSQAAKSYSAVAVFDPWQAVGMAQRLGKAGVRVEEYPFTAQSVGRLASTLHLLLRDRMLSLPPDEDLLAELAAVRLREGSIPGTVRLDHDSGHHDDQAVALGLACVHLLTQPSRGVGQVSYRPESTFADKYVDVDSGRRPLLAEQLYGGRRAAPEDGCEWLEDRDRRDEAEGHVGHRQFLVGQIEAERARDAEIRAEWKRRAEEKKAEATGAVTVISDKSNNGKGA